MAEMHIEQETLELTIKLTIESHTNSVPGSTVGSYLLTAALANLIEEVDLSGWENAEDEIDQNAFLGAILASVARSYNHVLPEPQDDVAPYDILKQLIEELHNTGYL